MGQVKGRPLESRLDLIEGTATHVRGWSSSLAHREMFLGLFNAAETNWRRVARLTFNADPAGAASYTGASFVAEVMWHKQSWAQTMPQKTLQQTIRITVSNAFTTSNFQTAAIGGEWDGYDWLRVVKISAFSYEVHFRPGGQYHATGLRLQLLAQSGVTSLVYDEASDGGPPSAGTYYYFADNEGAPFSDSRGYLEITGAMMTANAVQYQAGIGNDWTPRMTRKRGIVYLSGLVTPQNTAAVAMFTLPAGFRPHAAQNNKVMFQQMQSNNYPIRVDVYADGTVAKDTTVSAVSGAGSWINLGGIIFPASD